MFQTILTKHDLAQASAKWCLRVLCAANFVIAVAAVKECRPYGTVTDSTTIDFIFS